MTIYPYSKTKQIKKNIFDVQEFKAIVKNEHTLQKQCEEYLDLRKIKYIRFPDAAYNAIFGNYRLHPKTKKLISSFMKGLPDLILLEKITDEYCMSLCIELKTEKGKMSQGQKNFARQLPVKIIRSFECFQGAVEKFLKDINNAGNQKNVRA